MLTLEELMMSQLDFLLSSSGPGDEIQGLHIITAPRGPLGTPDESQMEVTVYAIVPDETPTATMSLVRKVIATAAAQDVDVLFAAVRLELWTVTLAGLDARQMAEVGRFQREERLREHPAATEITVVYAACHDGRRWGGVRHLTGPKAGQKEAVNMYVGRLNDHSTCRRRR
jgi:hypothetical protein